MARTPAQSRPHRDRSPSRGGAEAFVSEDRRCVGCGYNLRGVPARGRCPECGRGITPRRRGWREGDSIVKAPVSWLLGFKLGATLLIGSLIASVAAPIALAVTGRAEHSAAAMVVIGAAWWIGVMIATRPRPVMPTTDIEPRLEWCGLRVASRLTQACWPLAYGLHIAIGQILAAGLLPPTALYYCEGALIIIAAGGLIPLCIYMSNLSWWAADSGLTTNFRACVWTVSIATLALLGLQIAWFAIAGPGGGMGLMSMVGGMGVFFGGLLMATVLGHLGWCLFRLRGMAAWAVINHITADHVNERLRERAERAALRQEALRGPKV